MRKKNLSIIGYLLFGASIFLFGYMLFEMIGTFRANNRVYFDMIGIMQVAVVIAIIALLGTLVIVFCSEKQERTKHVRRYFTYMFIVYVIFLIEALIVSRVTNARIGSMIGENQISFTNYFIYETNFIPFKTIGFYLMDGGKSVNMRTIIDNLFGNLVLFSPFGFFLPYFFKKMRKVANFLMAAVTLNVIIEGAQLMLRVGSCDIDDIILNMIGCMVVFLIYRTKFVQNIFEKLYIIQE
ncbi:teicoplanin resistance protein vanZ [Lachnospiraceae bacterium KM106-2]|nr:teicoplanin resistance protein vanZ [Lachnospiraceae bacterium KM106-2]